MKTYPNDMITAFTEVGEITKGVGMTRWRTHNGLTKREYFAAMAMQGLLSNGEYKNQMVSYVTDYSVDFADSLIKELNKQQDNENNI
jgi:hypothetical protein